MTESLTEKRIAAAQAGDQQAFSDLVEPYRAELLVHCYRLLGSPQDAEDMVQETFLRAWNRLDTFVGGVYFRAWLYKIATNLSLDALDKRTRRLLSPATFPPSDPHAPLTAPDYDLTWLEPFPDELLPDLTLSPEAHYTLRESITLAFLAVLQFLPPRQRVTLILCDVLDWRANDVAQLLDTTASAINSALHRARATMNAEYAAREPESVLAVDHLVRGTLKRYVEAWESGDVDTLIALLRENVVFTMPPMSAWFSGRDSVRVHAETMCFEIADRWRLVETRANQQIAFACYRRDPHDGRFYAHALQLLTLDGAHITEIQMFFLPSIFPRFKLPMEWKP